MDLQLTAACDEYIGWLQVEANRSPNTVRAYRGELHRFTRFLAERGHSLRLADLGREDLRAYQRHLARLLPSPASRARALVAIRSWLRWLAREELIPEDLSNRVTVPRIEQRLPKPLPPEELTLLLRSLPAEKAAEKRDRALVHFLISTGCRISEALRLDRSDVPRQGNRLVVRGKGAKERSVYLTDEARDALEDYLQSREDTSPALFVNYDRASLAGRDRRLTAAGARHIVNRIRHRLGVWSFRSPHVARHTTATTLLEVTQGDVRLVQEILGHANLNTLQGYTKIVDARKRAAYRRYGDYLAGRAALSGPAPWAQDHPSATVSPRRPR